MTHENAGDGKKTKTLAAATLAKLAKGVAKLQVNKRNLAIGSYQNVLSDLVQGSRICVFIGSSRELSCPPKVK